MRNITRKSKTFENRSVIIKYLPSLSSCSINWLDTRPHPDMFKWVKFGQHFLAIRRPTLKSWKVWPPPSTNDESASENWIKELNTLMEFWIDF